MYDYDASGSGWQAGGYLPASVNFHWPAGGHPGAKASLCMP